jgi:hydroxylysine kinase
MDPLDLPDLLQSIAATPPEFHRNIVAAAVAEQFGLSGNFTLLVSERDQNFALTTAGKDRYVIKVTSLEEDTLVTDFQIAALLHLEKSGALGVPRMVRTVSGADRGVIQSDDGTRHCLRVVTWLHGNLLAASELSQDIARSFGHRLAELDLVLANFNHEGDGQLLLWDTQRAGELRNLLVHVDEPAVRQELTRVLDYLDVQVVPGLERLPNQVIHNDANTENILLDAKCRVSGIIDFGDMLRAPRIIEVSTAAAYLRSERGDPMEFIAPFVAGYQERNSLCATELDLLFDLIRTRLAMTLVLFYWRLSARDEDDPYRQKLIANEGSALNFLRRLSDLGRPAFRARLAA